MTGCGSFWLDTTYSSQITLPERRFVFAPYAAEIVPSSLTRLLAILRVMKYSHSLAAKIVKTAARLSRCQTVLNLAKERFPWDSLTF